MKHLSEKRKIERQNRINPIPFFKHPKKYSDERCIVTLQSITALHYEGKPNQWWNKRIDTKTKQTIFVSAKAFATQEEAIEALKFFNQTGEELFNIVESMSQSGYFKIATTPYSLEELSERGDELVISAILQSICRLHSETPLDLLWNKRSNIDTDVITFVSNKAFVTQEEALKELEYFNQIGKELFRVVESLSQPGCYKIATQPSTVKQLVENLKEVLIIATLQSITTLRYEVESDRVWNKRTNTDMGKAIFVSGKLFETQEEALQELAFFNQIGKDVFSVVESVSQAGYYRIATKPDLLQQLTNEIQILDKNILKTMEKGYPNTLIDMAEYMINGKVPIKVGSFERIDMGEMILPMYYFTHKTKFIPKEEFDELIEQNSKRNILTFIS